MTTNAEQYADLILVEIITAAERAQAEIDKANGDNEQWHSARLAARLIGELDGELPRVSIYRAVAKLYQRSDNTIKRRLKVALMVSPTLQAAHVDLSFSHWRTCCDAVHQSTPEESMLDIVWQIEAWKDRGEMPAVSLVEGWVYGKDHGERAKHLWRIRGEAIYDRLEKIKVDGYAPDDFRGLIGYCQTLIQSYLDTGISPLNPRNTS